MHFQCLNYHSFDFIDPMKLQMEIEKAIRSNGESAVTRLDRMMSSALNKLTSKVNNMLFPKGLLKPFPRNCLSLMTTTGAKGGLVSKWCLFLFFFLIRFLHLNCSMPLMIHMFISSLKKKKCLA